MSNKPLIYVLTYDPSVDNGVGIEIPVEVPDFIQGLREVFPIYTIEVESETDFRVYMDVPEYGPYIVAGFHQVPVTFLEVSTFPEDTAIEISFLYRQHVDEEHRLFLALTADSRTIEITKTMLREQIRSFLVGSSTISG